MLVELDDCFFFSKPIELSDKRDTTETRLPKRRTKSQGGLNKNQIQDITQNRSNTSATHCRSNNKHHDHPEHPRRDEKRPQGEKNQ